jgi:hypothetical protein
LRAALEKNCKAAGGVESKQLLAKARDGAGEPTHDPGMFADALDWATLAARFGVAIAAGAVIGWDRPRAGKPAAALALAVLVAMKPLERRFFPAQVEDDNA